MNTLVAPPYFTPDLLRDVAPILEPLQGLGYRSAVWGYAGRKALLSGEGGYRFGGRWNPPGAFRAVYASVTLETATKELLHGNRTKGLLSQGLLPRVFLSFEFQCQRALDLSLPKVLASMGLSVPLLLEADWLAAQAEGKYALPQHVGSWAWSAGVEVLKVPSAAHEGGSNWVFFPENFGSGSRLLLHLPPDWPD